MHIVWTLRPLRKHFLGLDPVQLQLLLDCFWNVEGWIKVLCCSTTALDSLPYHYFKDSGSGRKFSSKQRIKERRTAGLRPGALRLVHVMPSRMRGGILPYC